MTKQNFLLARGERLTHPVEVKSGGQEKEHAYTFSEARSRIAPMLADVSRKLDALPKAACPDDQAVATLTLNPEYIAKSYFPGDLLRSVGLTSVGSRPRRVTPGKRSRGREPVETATTELFLKGTRRAFRRWSEQIGAWRPDADGAKQLPTIEEVAVPAPADKLIHIEDAGKTGVFEVVLHADEESGEDFYVPKFKEYLKSIGLNPPLERRFYAGGLCFLELEAPRSKMRDVAAFSMVRAIRPMPPLRMLRPAIRTAGVATDTVALPKDGPIDPKIRSVIFDGGIPEKHPLRKWASVIDTPGVGPVDENLLKHGVGVTSAFLFGHVIPNKPAPRPFSAVHHYRVVDTEPGQNPYELYEVLDRIQNVLASDKYEFINLSLGPELPIDDDEVHAWTAVLDDYLSRGDCLAVVAAGNGGEGDEAIGANRVQVPADCVNALAVGSADSPDAAWARALYSSVGPGRSPGLIKPSVDRRRGLSSCCARRMRRRSSRPAERVLLRRARCGWAPACALISGQLSTRSSFAPCSFIVQSRLTSRTPKSAGAASRNISMNWSSVPTTQCASSIRVRLPLPNTFARRSRFRTSRSKAWSRSRRRFATQRMLTRITPATTRAPASKSFSDRTRRCFATRTRSTLRPRISSARTGRV
jgi:hypothetical protein